jgi:16S rRNA (cytidine1402-2'-O)-methyltransferase
MALFLIPSELYESQTDCMPSYIVDAVKQCTVFFVENARTSRRFLKRMWKEMPIDDFEWFEIGKAEADVQQQFLKCLKQQKNIGIISEAGCPGVADPGQLLVHLAQQQNVQVKPLVGPSSILLALMASGMNGQKFQFHGYLPIESSARKNAIKELEADSAKRNCTQIFIETPYRNNQLLQEMLATCKDTTQVCVAVDMTAATESIVTKSVADWKNQLPELHKRLCIFLIYGAG